MSYISAEPHARDPVVDRVPFFYGWVMLPIAVVALVASSPGQTFGVSAFNPSFRASLNLSHSQLTGAYMFGTLLACLPLAYVGALMDRYGIRRSMAAAVVLFAGACVFTSQVTGLYSLFFAFLLLRMFGQGSLTLLASNTLAMWFHDRLGAVSGLSSIGMSAAIAIVPRVFLRLILEVGWRWAYAVLGVAVLVVMLPLLAVFFRNSPEEVGQYPDGTDPAADEALGVEREAGASEMPDGAVDYDLRATFRTRSYWIMLGVSTVWAMVATGIFFNIIPLFESRGLTETDAMATFTSFAVCAAAMQLVGGILADRVRLNILLSIGMAGMTGGIMILLRLDSPWMGHFYSMVFGSFQGVMSGVGSTLWVRYFGRANLGKIRGTVWTATVAGSSLGPFVMGVAFDHFGRFDESLWLFAGLFFPLAFAGLFATPPRPTAGASPAGAGS